MNLLDKQKVFSRLIAKLVLRAYDLGYEITFGEAYRPSEMAEIYAKQGRGIKNSLHGERLAVDLNLFKDGHYTTDTRDFEELGLWWEQQSTDAYECCWGGRFNDGNHFSIGHRGLK